MEWKNFVSIFSSITLTLTGLRANTLSLPCSRLALTFFSNSSLICSNIVGIIPRSHYLLIARTSDTKPINSCFARVSRNSKPRLAASTFIRVGHYHRIVDGRPPTVGLRLLTNLKNSTGGSLAPLGRGLG